MLPGTGTGTDNGGGCMFSNEVNCVIDAVVINIQLVLLESSSCNLSENLIISCLYIDYNI